MTPPARPVSTGARLNLFALRITRGWLRAALLILAVYISLPWIAPTLMRLGAETPARAIYTLYRPMCHQFAFRTFFLYGQQSAYPLADATSAAPTGLQPFESFAGRSRIPAELRARVTPQPPFDVRNLYNFAGLVVPDDIASTATLSPAATSNFAQFQIRSAEFIGNPQLGYKMTLCERDIAIYTAMFAGGLIFSIPRVRRRLRPAPLWLFILLGIAPIAIDGFSQWFGYPPFQLWPPRETLPIFRVLTGASFGLMIAWLGFPNIDAAMRDAGDEIADKLRAAGYPA
jgi:uncharacterized membrane protein